MSELPVLAQSALDLLPEVERIRLLERWRIDHEIRHERLEKRVRLLEDGMLRLQIRLGMMSGIGALVGGAAAVALFEAFGSK